MPHDSDASATASTVGKANGLIKKSESEHVRSQDLASAPNFLNRVKDALGPEMVLEPHDINAYEQNVSARRRSIAGVLLPDTRQAVRDIVSLANEYRVPLYPISKGRNWGLGSKLPVTDGCVIVDLQRLNRIVAVDPVFGHATIEPGVTQAQLADMIAESDCPFFLDVTGSGRDSSIVGNALERGVAYNSLRVETLLSLEVVLGNGETIRTGFGHYPTCQTLTPLFPQGIGPSLCGLFTQSNFGIVTEATIKLLPKPESCRSFLLSLRQDQDLPDLIDAMRALKQQGVLRSVVHVANQRRSRITLAPLVYQRLRNIKRDVTPADAEENLGMGANWTAIGNLMGTRRTVKQATCELKKHLARFGKLRFIHARKLNLARRFAALTGQWRMRAKLEVAEVLYGLNFGVPSDAPLHSLFWPLGKQWDGSTNPDETDVGIHFAVPVIPMRGRDVSRALSAMSEVEREFGFETAATLNLCHDTALEGVLSIDFPQDDSQKTEQAHNCLRRILTRMIELGYHPYRIDVENLDLVVNKSDPFWRTTYRMKAALDPNDIISPGRFNLTDASYRLATKTCSSGANAEERD